MSDAVFVLCRGGGGGGEGGRGALWDAGGSGEASVWSGQREYGGVPDRSVRVSCAADAGAGSDRVSEPRHCCSSSRSETQKHGVLSSHTQQTLFTLYIYVCVLCMVIMHMLIHTHACVYLYSYHLVYTHNIFSYIYIYIYMHMCLYIHNKYTKKCICSLTAKNTKHILIIIIKASDYIKQIFKLFLIYLLTKNANNKS